MSSETCRFFLPGPTWVRPDILKEMSRPIMGHRSPEFRQIVRKLLTDLQQLFGTTRNTFIATCSGTGILEAALLNCVSRRVLVTTNGAFSQRWLHLAGQLGLEADPLEHAWGEAVDPARLADHFRGRRYHYDAVTITHSETSTGVMNDLRTLARVVHEESRDTLILVDAVSSLGCAPIHFDDWGIDVCLASTQKGLALPPGITVFAVSDRAMVQTEKKPYRGLYFDFLEFQRRAAEDGVPFTPSIPHYYALSRQLDFILREETLERRWRRHLEMRDLTLERTAPFANPVTARESASLSVSTVRPLQKPALEVVNQMKQRGFTIGTGYGDWKETTFRIGHMGDIPVDALMAMLDVLEEVAR
jgi:aspartate aminotransferase-like enzyme